MPDITPRYPQLHPKEVALQTFLIIGGGLCFMHDNAVDPSIT